MHCLTLVRTLFLLLILTTTVFGFQVQTQKVSGTVLDQTTQQPLVGANIILLDHEPLMGTSTDGNGKFELNNVPMGRQSFKVTYLGYQTAIIPDILVTSGKEVVLTIKLEEDIFEGESVNVTADIRKDQPLNDMAFVSAKAISIEETQRYAGGLEDPARLVTAFAGVTSSGGIQTNAISIRGNAPKSVQWRLEGIEIPNPSHFAGLSVTGGGGLTLFSSQLLANSDFMTSAFPAEYGNVLSGVFDINFRSGNPDRREHAFKVGINGIEASSGGPIRKGGSAMYLFNYRFSTLTLLMPILPTEGTIMYQDLSFNLDFPTQHAGRFSLWGIGGADRQTLDAKRDSSQWEYLYWDFSDNEIDLGVGAVGMSHSILVNDGGYLKTSLAASGNLTDYSQDRLDTDYELHPYLNINNKTGRMAFKSYLNQKMGDRITTRTGVELQHLFYDIDLKADTDHNMALRTLRNGRGDAFLGQAYTQAKFQLSPEFTAQLGLHAQWFSISDQFLAEPRASVRWDATEQTSFNLGYGLHSQIEDLSIYFVETPSGKPNQNLNMARAHHWVAGWDQSIGTHHRTKVELFYQRLFDVPVIADSSFSMINYLQDLMFDAPLVNEGEGENYGVEFTLERFLNHGFYYLFTGTWYSSRYQGGDGVWRKSRFDQRVALNGLGGKEFMLHDGKNILGINLRLTVAGGERFSPIASSVSEEREEVVFNERSAYSKQFDTQYIADLTMNWKTNRSGYATTWALQLKNLLMAEDYSYDYNYQTNKVDKIAEGTILPFLSWKIEF